MPNSGKMRKQVELFLTLIAIAIAGAQIRPPPKVLLSNGGTLIGSYMFSSERKVIEAFRGIPFAKPPVGDLRFSAPEKYPAWSGVRIADHDSQPCPQQDAFGIDRTFFGSEDCLYLNVYTPQKRQPNATLSVMVFFHGGGFLYGGSSSQIYGPQRLLDNNIVLVTTNYRLGALGFLTTGTADSPGNNGLKDQVMALKWVKDNIAAFGGLPEDVTIFGHSAGAASVAYHLVSPLSKGLFSKAILQSGNSFDPWAIINTETAIDRARRVGEILNCTENDGYDRFPEMIKCLRDKSAENITLTTEEFYIVDGEPINVFGPVLEHSNINGAFLTENPDQIKNSYGTNVPVMIGVTSGEGIFKSAPILYGYRDEFQENFREILPSLLVYDELPLSIQDAVTEKIDDFYFKKDHKWSRRRHQNLTNLFSDRLFYYGMDKFLRNRLATTKNSSTYVYFFNHKGPKSLSQLYGGGLSYYGVAHGDELPFLFPLVQDHLHGSKYDKKMRWAMPKMWTDFAKTGNPTPSLSSIKQQWMPASKFPLNYARIGAEDYKNSHHQTNENDKIKKTENSQANDSVKLTENMTQQGIQKSGTKKHRSIRNTVSILEKTPNLRESKKHRKHKKKEKKAKRKEIVTNEIGLAEERMKFWRNLEQFMATAKSRGEEAQTESQIKEDIQKGA